MSTKTIPAQTIMTCDCCQAVITKDNHRQSGKLLLKADALDMHGHAVADATRSLDLCDSCLHDINKALGEVIAARSNQGGA